MLYMHRPVDSAGAGLLFRSELTIHMPPSDLHVVYAPPGSARLLIRLELRIRVSPSGFEDVLYAPRWCLLWNPVD